MEEEPGGSRPTGGGLARSQVTALDLTADQQSVLEEMVAAGVAVQLYRQAKLIDPVGPRAGCSIIGNCSNGSCDIIGNCSSSSHLVGVERR
jgi:hypothetical protein